MWKSDEYDIFNINHNLGLSLRVLNKLSFLKYTGIAF